MVSETSTLAPNAQVETGNNSELNSNDTIEVVDFGDGNTGHVTWHEDGTSTVVEVNTATGEVVSSNHYDTKSTADYRVAVESWRAENGSEVTPTSVEDVTIESATAQPPSEKIEPNNESFKAGDVLRVDDNLSYRVVGTEGESGRFAVYEQVGGIDGRALLLSQEELERRATKGTGRTDKSQQLIDYLNSKDGGSQHGSDEGAQAAVTEPSAGNAESILTVNRGGSDSEIVPVTRTLDEAKAELAAARSEYGNLGDKQGPRANELRSQIKTLHEEVVDWVFNHPEGADEKEDGSEVSPRTLSEAKAELAAARSEYGSLADKQSARAAELRSQIKTLHEEVVGWADNHPDGADEKEDSTTEAGERTPTSTEIILTQQIEIWEKEQAEKLAAFAALSQEDQMGEKGAALKQEFRDLDKQINEAKETLTSQSGDEAEEQTKQEKAAKEEAAAKAEKEIRDSLAEVEARRQAALEKYAQAKAEYDTRGMLNPFGKRRRKQNVDDAAKELKQIELEFAKQFSDKKREAGLYQGEEAETMQQAGTEMFDQLRAMATDRRNAYVAERLTRMSPENQKWHDRALLKVGNMLNKGGKVWQALKSGGIGVATGAAKGIAIALSGVTFPAVVGFGAATAAGGMLIGAAAGKANLDNAFKAKAAAELQKPPVGAMTNEQFAQFMEQMQRSGIKNQGTIADRLVDSIHNKAVAEGQNDLKESLSYKRRAMGAYAVGSLIGGLAGGGATRWIQGEFATPDQSKLVNKPDAKDAIPQNTEKVVETEPVLDLGADIGRGEGGIRQIGELLNGNGIDASQFTESEKLQMWSDVTGKSTDIYQSSGKDLYMMKDGYYGISAPNSANTWNKDAAQMVINQAKAIIAGRG